MKKPLTNATVQLSGTDENTFSIIAKVKGAISKSDRPDLVTHFVADAMSGDYDHVLQTCMRYVEVE